MKKLLLLFPIILLSFSSIAQTAWLDGNLQIGAGWNGGEIGGVGLGATLLGRGTEDSPVFFGVDANFIRRGGVDQNISNHPALTSYKSPSVSTNNNLISLHGIMRIVFDLGQFKPYVEGLLGFRTFYTRTTLSAKEWNDQEGEYEDNTLGTDVSISDATFSIGPGGGFIFGQNNLSLNLRFNFLGGNEVDVYTEEHLEDMKYSIGSSGSVTAQSMLAPLSAISRMFVFSLGLSTLF